MKEHGISDLTLTLVGAGRNEATLRELVRALGLQDVVTFAGKRDRDELPDIYRQHGTLVLPSCWDEPFAITPLEAMASGLAVVGTTRGGSRELFVDGVNALTFAGGDSAACAAQLRRLRNDPDLWRALSREGARTIVSRFQLSNMSERVERHIAQSGLSWNLAGQ